MTSLSLFLGVAHNTKTTFATFMGLMRSLNSGIAFAAIALAFAACTDKKIEMTSPALEEYFPMQTGKYITYRLDSTVPTRFGADTTVRSYRVRDKFDAQITDGLGRAAYRVVRTISDVNGSAAYVPNNTFMAIPQTDQSVEWVENNLRFLKLLFPIKDGFTWKGNNYIDANSLNSSVRYLADWEYRYENVGQPFTVNGKTYPNTITIWQRNEVLPEGPFNANFYKQYNYSVEVYAQGIGLIYKNFDHKVWQPPVPSDAKPGYWEDGSYRVILRIIDNN